MGCWNPSPPQGFTPEQELTYIGGPVSPRFPTPQGAEGGAPKMGLALVQTGTLTALVQTGTLTALIQTGSG